MDKVSYLKAGDKLRSKL